MGNLSKGQDLAPFGCNSDPNQSDSDPCHRVVLLEAPYCLEPHLSPHAIESMVGVSLTNGPGMAEFEESLAGVPNGHPNTSRKERICVERATVGFVGVNLARIKVGSGTHRKKNAEEVLITLESLGQQELLYASSSLSPNGEICNAAWAEGMGDGCHRAFDLTSPRGRIYQPLHEQEGMEFDRLKDGPS